MSDKKPHSVTVSIVSVSDGVTNQEVILREYAGSAEELVYKNHAMADAVVVAINDCMKGLSGAFLAGKQPR
jgi:hypothetical protein